METIKRIIKNVLGKTQAECKAKLAAAMEAAKGVDISRADEYTVATWLRSWYDIYAGPLRCGFHSPHLHPRNKAEARRGRTNDGQLHGTGDVNAENDKNTGEETELPLRCSFALSAHFVVWVTVWVRRLTHILTRTVFNIFATKKHRKPKLSMLFGAAGRIRTADLILTKDALYLLSYSSKCGDQEGARTLDLQRDRLAF